MAYRKFDLEDFYSHPFPPVERIIEPWLKTRGLTMIAGYRGVGKTFFSLTAAYAVASGGAFLSFRATKARPVLYVDGEMDPAEVQERLQAIEAGMGNAEVARKNLRYITYATEPFGLQDLASDAGRRALEAQFEEEVMFLDNISSLVRYLPGSVNDADSWVGMQEWLIHLRAKGKSVVLIDHTGKPSEDRAPSPFGTSAKERVLDSTLILERLPRGIKGFKILADKARGFEPWDPIKAKVVFHDGVCRLEPFETEDLASTIRELHAVGTPLGKIAETTKTNLQVVRRHLL